MRSSARCGSSLTEQGAGGRGGPSVGGDGGDYRSESGASGVGARDYRWSVYGSTAAGPRRSKEGIQRVVRRLLGGAEVRVGGSIEEEFGAVDLGDERLHCRLQIIAGVFFARPTMNIPQACGSRAKAKAVYRFLDHPQAHLDSVLKAHYQATSLRVGAYPAVLAVQDTTELIYTAHGQCEMLGPIGDRQYSSVGLLMHDTMAYNLEGTPLGLIDVQCWARDPEDRGKSQRRHALPIEQKEGYKWLVSYRAIGRWGAKGAAVLTGAPFPLTRSSGPPSPPGRGAECGERWSGTRW